MEGHDVEDGNDEFSIKTTPVSIENEVLVLNYIRDLCFAYLKKYPTTINEDYELLRRIRSCREEKKEDESLLESEESNLEGNKESKANVSKLLSKIKEEETNGDVSIMNVINCILMRIGEKRILNFYVEFTEYFIDLLNSGLSKEVSNLKFLFNKIN